MPCCESDLRGFVCHSVCSQISSNICPSRATRASPSSFVVVVPRVARRASRARAHHFKSALHVELSGASSRARRARTFAEPEKSSEGEYGLNPLTGEPLEAKGQLTAIVTGVVSVALALGYLALVQVMDSREMVAPPEEAFGDGSVRPADERARRGE